MVMDGQRTDIAPARKLRRPSMTSNPQCSCRRTVRTAATIAKMPSTIK
jgi:hypothetical protein